MERQRCDCCGRPVDVLVVLVKGDLEARRLTCERDARTIAKRAIARRYADAVSLYSVA